MDVNNDIVPVLNGLYAEYGRLIEKISTVQAAASAMQEMGKAYGLQVPENPHPRILITGVLPVKAEATYEPTKLTPHAAKVEPLALPVEAPAAAPAPALSKVTAPVSNTGKPPFIQIPKPPARPAAEPVKPVTSSASAPSAPATVAPAPAPKEVSRPPVIHQGIKPATLATTATASAKRIEEQARMPSNEGAGAQPGPKGPWLTVDQFKERLSAWNPQINTGGLSLTDIYQALRTRGCRFGYGLPPEMDLSDSNTVRVLSNHLRHEWVPGYPQHCQSLQTFSSQGSLYKTIRDKAEAAVHFAFPEMAKAKMGKTQHYSSSVSDSRPLRSGANSPFAGLTQLIA